VSSIEMTLPKRHTRCLQHRVLRFSLNALGNDPRLLPWVEASTAQRFGSGIMTFRR
jgi:hypothetical protein